MAFSKFKYSVSGAALLGASLVHSAALSQETKMAEKSDDVTVLRQKASDLRDKIDSLKTQIKITELKQQIEELEVQTRALDRGEPMKVSFDGPSPKIANQNGAYAMKLRGQVNLDAGYVDGPGGPVSATKVRRARLGVQGNAGHGISYLLIAEVQPDASLVRLATISFDAPLKVTVGVFKVLPSRDEATSSQVVDALERYHYTDAFNFAPRVGMGLSRTGESYGVNIGVFGGELTDTDPKQSLQVSGRAWKMVNVNDHVFHVGGSALWRRVADDGTPFGYKSRPATRLNPVAMSTGGIFDKEFFIGGEILMVIDNFSLDGEFGQLKATPRDAALYGPTPKFQGGGVTLSWFMTGEEKPYDVKKGAYGRIKVTNPLGEAGWGAFQGVLRADMVDMHSENILAGEQFTITSGLNWYWTAHTRLLFNVAQTWVNDSADTVLYGADGSGKFTTVAMRAQLDF